MRLKALIVLAITTTLLMAALAVSIHTCRKLSADRNRLLQNQTQLLQAATAPDTTRTTDGRNVLITPTITLKPAEFLASGDPLLQRARAMHIRPSRITQAATAAAETHTNITASITTDSFTYTDAYTTLTGIIHTDSSTPFTPSLPLPPTSTLQQRIQLQLTTHDTLDIIVHRIPRRFLFLRFGCRAVKLTISPRNPKTHLTYARFYKIQK